MSTKRKKMKSRKTSNEKKFASPIPLTNVKVVGVGGGGGNVISRMSKDFARGIEFIGVNTDHQDLDHCEVRKKIYIGKNLTRGLGTGMSPDIGRQAAEENRSEIAEALSGADLIFIASCFGGGTGTGAGPVVAEVAKQTGALTIGFVTKPFGFEGSQRERIAVEGVNRIRDKVDALVVVPNDRIFTVIDKDTPIMKAFEVIDDVLKSALRGIVEFIVTPGLINVDFADVRNIIQDAGSAIVGVGIASGPDRAIAAVNQAMNSPLLETNPEGAKGVLLGISGNRDMKMTEINEAAKVVAQMADSGARIIFGAYYDRRLKPNQFKVTLVATGFNEINSGGSLFSGKSDFFGGKKPQPEPDEEKTKQIFQPVEDKIDQKAKQPDFKSVKQSPVFDDKKKEKERETDIWDIPTFLRKKKR